MSVWLVAKGGADTNGGTSQAVKATGTHGVTNGGNNNLVDSTANAFTAQMVGQGVMIGTHLRTITAYTSASTVVYSGANLGVLSGQTWTVGGMRLTVNALLNTQAAALASGDQVYVGAGVYRETVTVGASGAATATGTHGVTSGTGFATFTDSTANGFTSGMVGQIIQVSFGGAASAGFPTLLCKVTAYTSSSVITIASATAQSLPSLAFSSCSWTVGQIAVIGDVDGAQTGAAGEVMLTGYTTNDTTAPSGTTLLAFGSQDYWAFSYITFVMGAAAITSNTAGHMLGCSFTDCALLGSSAHALMAITGTTTGVAQNVTVNRCYFWMPAANSPITVALATTNSGSADFDSLICFANCLMLILGNATGVTVTATGTNTHLPGGVRAYNCTISAGGTCFVTNTASELSTTIPCEVHNSLLLGGIGLSAATSGQLTETNNLIYCSTPRNNVSAGAGSVSNGSYAPLVDIGQVAQWSGCPSPRPFLAPSSAKSPLISFGSASYGGAFDGQFNPRPAGGLGIATTGGLPCVGAFEYGQGGVQDVATFTDGILLTGAGYQEIMVPVDATGTIASIEVEFVAVNYTNAGSNYPQIVLLADAEIGVAAQAVMATSAGGTQTLTFSSITPTAAGFVLVQCCSYDQSNTTGCPVKFGVLAAT